MPREHSFSEVFGDEIQEETKTPEELALEKEEEEARAKKHNEAAARYEAGIGKNLEQREPDESTDQNLKKLEEVVERKARHQDKILAEIHKPNGLKSRRSTLANRRGHRKGLKPIKHREAA